MDRNCTYGPVTPNGRCPSKPKECAYGTRKNGMCPRAPCKWGELESGKCRGKPASMRCASGALRGPPDYLCTSRSPEVPANLKTPRASSGYSGMTTPRSSPEVPANLKTPRASSGYSGMTTPRSSPEVLANLKTPRASSGYSGMTTPRSSPEESDSASDYDVPLKVLANKPKFWRTKTPRASSNSASEESDSDYDVPLKVLANKPKFRRTKTSRAISGVGRMRQVNGRIIGVRKTIRTSSSSSRSARHDSPAYDPDDSTDTYDLDDSPVAYDPDPTFDLAYDPDPILPRHSPKRGSRSHSPSGSPDDKRQGSRPYSPSGSPDDKRQGSRPYSPSGPPLTPPDVKRQGSMPYSPSGPPLTPPKPFFT
jgi:hypothetical protein